MFLVFLDGVQALDLWLAMLRHRPAAVIPSAGADGTAPLPQTPLLAAYPMLLQLGLSTAIGDFLRPAMEILEEYLLAFVRFSLLSCRPLHPSKWLVAGFTTWKCRVLNSQRCAGLPLLNLQGQALLVNDEGRGMLAAALSHILTKDSTPPNSGEGSQSDVSPSGGPARRERMTAGVLAAVRNLELVVQLLPPMSLLAELVRLGKHTICHNVVCIHWLVRSDNPPLIVLSSNPMVYYRHRARPSGHVPMRSFEGFSIHV